MHQICPVRYFMDITYRGTPFSGWQTQPNAPTIQEEIEKGLALLLQKKTPLTGSGRTDAGVHASHQIAHFEAADIVPAHLQHKLNAFLPRDIAINEIRAVQPEAHARFDAVARTYHYHLHQAKAPFLTGTSYYFSSALNVSRIHQACELITKWHNFECFSKVHTEVNHFNCNIYKADWQHLGSSHLFVIQADRFLRGMVRAIVGTLLDVGLQKTSIDRFQEILESNDRKKAGRAVPAQGLFLQEVSYPKEIYLD